MLNIDSISTLCDLLGCEKPKHPLISIIDHENLTISEDLINTQYVYTFYSIALKHGTDCELKYGRKYYDFNEGSLVFTAPGQVLESGKGQIKPKTNTDGWTLCIHPDLIKGSSLWRKMPEYRFFEYDANEALHLSDSEKNTIEQTLDNIKKEYSANIDLYSKELIVSNLELLFNYSNRFYGRQFITRSTANKEIVEQFNSLLTEQCSFDTLEQIGQPSVKELAGTLGYSPNYLSDILKKETGKTAQEHIKLQVLELAETLLLKTNEPIYLIAEKLGFSQPASFTKFIKAQHGLTPVDFRKQHIN